MVMLGIVVEVWGGGVEAGLTGVASVEFWMLAVNSVDYSC